MQVRSSHVGGGVARRRIVMLLAGLVAASALTVCALAWFWLQCWLQKPYQVQAIFSRIERMSAGIAAVRAAEEAHHQRHGTYSSDNGTLAASLDPDLSLEINYATETGYAAALRLPAAQLLCDLRIHRDSAPPQDLQFACRPCILDSLKSLGSEFESLTLYTGETGRIRAIARGAGTGCRGRLDALFDWEQIRPPTFVSSDSAVLAILQQRGSDASVYASEPGRASVAITAAGLDAEVTVTVLPVDPVAALASISAGQPTCGLSRTGDMYCWGADEPRRLLGSPTQGYCTGAGNVACSRVPRRVSNDLGWRAVTTGGDFVCGVASGGTVWCWGRNDRGQIGDGTTEDRTDPTAIAARNQFIVISAGSRHACGVTAMQSVYCWGANDAGQLGDGSLTDRNTPVRALGDERFASVSAGARHTCGVTLGGSVYCWGSNQFLQTGAADQETCEGQASRETFECSPTPTVVLSDTRFIAVSAGGRHTCAVAADGTAFCWGTNASGEVGDGSRTARTAATPTAGGLRFLSVSAGSERTCGVSTEGEAYCWGFLPWLADAGADNSGNDRTPLRVPADVHFVTIDMGENHLCALTGNGRAYCWGRNYQGQLGDGKSEDAALPSPIAGQEELDRRPL